MPKPCTWMVDRKGDPAIFVHAYDDEDPDICAIQFQEAKVAMGLDEMMELRDAVDAAIKARE